MQRYIDINDDNRIVLTSEEKLNVTQIQLDFAEDFDFEHQSDYKVINGEIVYDPIPIPAPPPTPQEDTDDLLLDHEERIIYLELGL